MNFSKKLKEKYNLNWEIAVKSTAFSNESPDMWVSNKLGCKPIWGVSHEGLK